MDVINLGGTIPVTVVVNTHTGEVERVVAHDDEFRYTGIGAGEVGGALNGSHPSYRKAKAIAESVMWPGWDWGW